MNVGYVLRRFGVFLIIIWLAATLSFLLPRLAPVNPIREKLLQAVSFGGAGKTDMEAVVKNYEAKFGLDQPLWRQYVLYISDMARFDFGISISNFPSKVIDIIMRALPWTIGLLLVSTLIAFVVGTLLGALAAWPQTPIVVNLLLTPLITLSSIPFYILGLILVYLLAFSLRWFPLSGGYNQFTIPSLNWAFMMDVLHHSILPALSIVLASIGSWAIGMRGMIISGLGEDYITFAEAKGLKDREIFYRYALRNALLPQTTSLALSLGYIVSGAVLVEVVFGYPGVGTVLYQAIRLFDYFVIYGIVMILILAIGLATLLIDLLYPLLDPRITYQGR
ncbi:MAG TPA: ABC transporter permease [Caldilineaceae bacterium]|nr:ABC transporter permease [Caldilineaceae bacterium]